jgi:hypothetical protein
MPCVSVKFNTSMFVEVHGCTSINVNITGGIDLRKTNVKNQNGRGKARKVHLVPHLNSLLGMHFAHRNLI